MTYVCYKYKFYMRRDSVTLTGGPNKYKSSSTYGYSRIGKTSISQGYSRISKISISPVVPKVLSYQSDKYTICNICISPVVPTGISV